MSVSTGGATPAPRERLLAPLRIPEFRALWGAEVLSVAGDQLARVALAVLVFQRTDSAALTGLTYALTFVPAFLGGALFGSLGDRHPRRTVMLFADCARAVLMAAAAIPGIPIWLLCCVVAATTFGNGPFKAAQQALLPAVLPAPLYTTGMALRSISGQTAQLAGFGGGGLVVATIGASGALGVNAATFAASALVLWVAVRNRPAATTLRVPFATAMRAGTALVWHDPALRTLAGLVWLAAFYVVPEALAAPYAAHLGGGSVAVGLLMGSDPAGSVIGGIVFTKWVPGPTRVRIVGLLGIAAGLPLALCAFAPGLVPSMILFALSGAAATGYTIQSVAEFTQRLPDDGRAQGSGLLSAGLLTVQGLGALLAGVVTDLLGPAWTIGSAGAVGALLAVPVALAWARHRRPVSF